MGPRKVGSIDSSFSRRIRASTGAVPPEEMATMMGARSIIEGKMNEQYGWSSTTLASKWRCSAHWETRALSAASSVAAITRKTSSSMAGSNDSPNQDRPPAWWISLSAGHNARAATLICAPARINSCILRAATSPPPTTSTGRRLRSANSGKYSTATFLFVFSNIMTILRPFLVYEILNWNFIYLYGITTPLTFQRSGIVLPPSPPHTIADSCAAEN